MIKYTVNTDEHMNTLREKIEEILIKENYTFKQLADYLNVSEKYLEDSLMNKTLELRHLEDISKNLKVPLYSFFRDNNAKVGSMETPYFTNKLWNNSEETSSQKLMEEIEILKQAILLKEAELAKKIS
jgi:transcriptional regulator with XRE-family HTH domain